MDMYSDLSDRLLFAIPKKGRLFERCMKLLEGADLHFRRNHRHDIALVQDLPIAFVFLRAADIATFVGDGRVDLGITGRDIVEECGQTENVVEVLPLNFGKCRLSVQVPVKSNIRSVDQLCGKRIITSFKELSSKYFAELDVKTAASTPTEIGYIGGSVEAACALGLADAIVDLVESGETMRAAGLTEIATILHTEALLIRNPRTPHLDLVNRVAARLEGVITAARSVYCSYNIHRDSLPAASTITPGTTAPTVSPLDREGWVAVNVVVAKADVAPVMERLKEIGATDILIFNISNCRI
ncbi:MAG: hypothetical protein DHS80DRAFT_23483 [Piptocephalis tieghemiana]|nr:MAG: hypothetical protein DHS80DRAFT_23483 [Piptocephalis tieghemiana]